MRGNTDRGKKKIAPIVVAVLVVLYMVPVLAVAVLSMAGLLEIGSGPMPVLFILLYVVVGAAVIGGVLLAMRQRLREIDGGEEEDASQY